MEPDIKTVKKRKKELRKAIKELKASLKDSDRMEKSASIFKKVEGMEAFKKSGTVFCFWSMDDEVYTQDFINLWFREKRFLLPCVRGDELELRVYEGPQSMVEGEQFKILEPKGPVFENYEDIDLALIPGVAFDKNLNRMGRGRGFYDRVLKRVKGNSLLMGICFDFQVTESVPFEAHDIKMDIVVKG